VGGTPEKQAKLKELYNSGKHVAFESSDFANFASLEENLKIDVENVSSTTWYHGAPKKYSELKKGSGIDGPGIYLTHDKSRAEMYAKTDAQGNKYDTFYVHEVKVNLKPEEIWDYEKKFDLRDLSSEPWFDEWIKEYGEESLIKSGQNAKIVLGWEDNQELIKRGYKAILSPSDLIVLDPSVIVQVEDKNRSEQTESELVLLEEGKEYKYHSVQTLLDPLISEKDRRFRSLQSSIPKEDLFEGEELPEAHVTLLYGLVNESDFFQVREKFSEMEPPKFKIGKITRFDNSPDFDVLKFDIESDDFHEINKVLREFDNECKYPDYHPHMTIAYIKKGSCKDLEGDSSFGDEEFVVPEAEWSHADGYPLALPFKKKEVRYLPWFEKAMKKKSEDVMYSDNDDEDMPEEIFDPEQLSIGFEYELRRVKDSEQAMEIAKDNLIQDPDYYSKRVDESDFGKWRASNEAV